ncbi:hypothetical protein PFMALIP_05244 [Plasmodium falciparum MaliPS096_E11]|uniref:Mitochondrial inner membrane protease ATP23 n=1 Tax=Plasmodium falciparum MaliPS096_E11 TaxID=1036727 RepID=A0A024WHL4_PLAFA|nr:hypothetical protein PFMALIP_05244 [Plasmodium falciparum MaliPS096_E11]
MEEISKKLEELKENIRRFNHENKIFDLIKNVENYFFSNKPNQKDNLNDMLFLIQYSLKYKGICKWPNYSNLFVINYNLNENFKSMVQNNKEFFEEYVKMNINKYNTKNKEENINRDDNKNHTKYMDSKENMLNNDHNNNNINNNNNNLFTKNDIELNEDNMKKKIKEHNQISNNDYKKMERKINTYFNDDISLFNKIKLQIFMYMILNNYRIKILVNSLSALNRPINVIYINCPNNKDQKKKIYEKFTNFFSSYNKFNNTYINNTKKNNYQGIIKNDNCSCSELSSLNQNIKTINNNSYNKKSDKYVGGYNPINNTIWLCSNNITNYYKLKYILTHELIHAFDFARANIDMYNCKHIACSEIRAYNLSNQCNYFNSKYFVGHKDVFNSSKSSVIENTSKNKCIYNNVYSSLYQYKPCSTDTHTYINNVFDKCLHDYWPFMCPPEQDSKYKPSKIFKKD